MSISNEELADRKTCSSSTDSGSDDSDLTKEDDRLRFLFDSCDQDSDGYLDRNDFLYMCSRLKMSNLASEIMDQLGMTESSLISFDDFLRFKHQVMNEPCDDYRETFGEPNPVIYSSMINSTYSEGQLMRSVTDSLSNPESGQFGPMSTWMTMSSDKSLGAQSGKPESTDYDSGARDLSPDITSPVTSMEDGQLRIFKSDNECISVITNSLNQMNTKYSRLTENRNPLTHLSSNYKIADHKFLISQQSDRLHLQEEYEDRLDQTVLRYEERITELHSVIAELRRKIDRQNTNVIREEDEADEGELPTSIQSEDDDEVAADAQSSLCQVVEDDSDEKVPPNLNDRINSNIYENVISSLPHYQRRVEISEKDKQNGGCVISHPTYTSIGDSLEDQPVSKIAELKRLKSVNDRSPSEFKSTSMNANAAVVEVLSRSLRDCHTLHDVVQLLYRCSTEMSENRVREYELDNERLSCSLENIRAQNRVLELTLAESRAQSEQLSVLLGKHESNYTALQLAVTYSDSALDVYEVLTDLLDSELAVLVASYNNQVSGPKSGDSFQKKLLQAQSTLKTAKNFARDILCRMKNDKHLQITGSTHVEQYNRSNSSTESSNCDNISMISNDKVDLKEFIKELRSAHAAVVLTIQELESVHMEPVVETAHASTSSDLEHAVLMQEFLSSKEEQAEVRAQNYLLEKEIHALELKLRGMEAQEMAHLLQIDQLKSDLHDRSTLCHRIDQNVERSQSGHVSQSFTSLMDHDEISKREQKMKQRIHELLSTLEKLSRNSESRQQQSSEFIGDLKQANSSLISAFEKAKKKYQNKIKKLEEELLAMREASRVQIAALLQRIKGLECFNSLPSPSNETAL